MYTFVRNKKALIAVFLKNRVGCFCCAFFISYVSHFESVFFAFTTEYLFCCICIGRQKPFLEVLVESQGFFSSSAFLCFF